MTDMTSPQPAKGFCQVNFFLKIREKLGIGGGVVQVPTRILSFVENLCILCCFLLHMFPPKLKIWMGVVGAVCG